jgi:hypothetical protein
VPAALRARLPRVADLFNGAWLRLVATTTSVIAAMGPGGANLVAQGCCMGLEGGRSSPNPVWGQAMRVIKLVMVEPRGIEPLTS